MDEAAAIASVVAWIRTRGLDYPTEALTADRFAAGWCVYAPADVDDSDPLAFLEMPVGQSVFLVGDSGRIKEVSSATPPAIAQDEFLFEEFAARPPAPGSEGAAVLAEFGWVFRHAAVPPDVGGFPRGPVDADDAAADQAEALLEPIARELARLGPPGWEWFSAEFSVTVSADVARVRFWTGNRSEPVPVPRAVVDLVRAQRAVAARMPSGPWWRLLVSGSDLGETTADYDYGVEPFPGDQLLAPGHYRNDVVAHPRPALPVWLAGYIAGPAAQGRPPSRAADDAAAGRPAVAAADLPPLGDLWTRWAVLAAVSAGLGEEQGPRIRPGSASYEDAARNGSTLYVLPGNRAVLSGGRWNSPLLDAAYNGGGPLPDLFTGAPAWVTDSVLDERGRRGLLTFCFWWTGDRWYRGETDTSGELGVALPPFRPLPLLEVAARRSVTLEDIADHFAEGPAADLDVAADQLSLAGLLEL